MEVEIETKEKIEGKTRLIVPKKALWKKVFYNPVMEFVRDLNVIITQNVLKYFEIKKGFYLDLLSGIGANGIRIANETEIQKVFLNEISNQAFNLLLKNIEINKLERKTKPLKKDAKKLFGKLKIKFDFVDIDPFGSPIYYLPFITKFLEKGSVLSLTATDTRTLFGLKEDTCLRRYGIKAVKADFYREFGVRVLITSSILTLARYSILAKPIFGYSKVHFVKVYFLIDRGKQKINEFLEKNIEFLFYCKNCLWRKYDKKIVEKCENCGKEVDVCFPIFSGKIFDESFSKFVLDNKEKFEYLKNQKEIFKIFENVENENISSFYYNTHLFGKKYKLKELPSLNYLIQKIRDLGFKAGRTVFSPISIKTDLEFKKFINMLINNDKNNN